MKKASYYIYCILAFALTFCLIVLVQNKGVKADVDYEINQVKVDAQVEKDESLLIKRKIKYDFDDSAHGVFYKQNLASGQKLKDSRVEVQDGKGRKILVKPGHGQNNSYQLTKDGNSYRFKVFHHISFFDKFTVTYVYRITNAVTNWADTAELNFKIIGDGWETDLDHVRINLNVGNGKKIADLKAWAHGPLDGRISLNRSRGIIKMTADHVPGDEGVEVHTIFPTKVTAHNKNIRKQKHRQAVIKQEAVLARQANARRKRNRILKITLVSLISILTGLLSIFTWIKAARTKSIGVKPKGIRNLPHIYDIPAVTPVQAQILKVRGFKKMLDDIGHFNTRDVGELILWEDIMPYAVAFGLSKKVINALHKDFSDQEIADAGLTTNHWLYLNMANDDFADNFSTSLDTGLDIGDSSDSSISGGSGGFSDGSSGGFGGGSGGGAF